MIRMMANFLGLSTFNKGIANYLHANSLSNANQDDLWSFLTAAGQVLPAPQVTLCQHQSSYLDLAVWPVVFLICASRIYTETAVVFLICASHISTKTAVVFLNCANHISTETASTAALMSSRSKKTADPDNEIDRGALFNFCFLLHNAPVLHSIRGTCNLYSSSHLFCTFLVNYQLGHSKY